MNAEVRLRRAANSGDEESAAVEWVAVARRRRRTGRRVAVAAAMEDAMGGRCGEWSGCASALRWPNRGRR